MARVKGGLGAKKRHNKSKSCCKDGRAACGRCND